LAGIRLGQKRINGVKEKSFVTICHARIPRQ
jgi:hypothetical protein